jgi:hypothetical protein
MLHRAGAIRFSQKIVAGRGDSVVLRTDSGTLVADLADSSALDLRTLDEADRFAKRSFQLEGYGDDDRIFPYGLCYPVYPAGMDLRIFARRGLPSSGRTGGDLFRALGLDRLLGWPPTRRVTDISPRPVELRPGEPRVACYTRLWPLLSDEDPDDPFGRAVMNRQRIEVVRALRRELGDLFVGGVARSTQSIEQCPDCLIEPTATAKVRGLGNVASTPIGVTTSGLEGSVGWRVGEYVGLGRAIVSETLHARVPGFAPEVNYLAFATPDECVSACVRLIDNPDQIEAMAGANSTYYNEHVRPDRIASRLIRQLEPSVSLPA